MLSRFGIITQKGKRIFIVYFLINLVAMLTSVLNVDIFFTLPVSENDSSEKNTHYVPPNWTGVDSVQEVYVNYIGTKVYLFTGLDKKYLLKYDKFEHFWPFVKFFEEVQSSVNTQSAVFINIGTIFWGVFRGYDITEFAVYIGLFLLIAFLRKLW